MAWPAAFWKNTDLKVACLTSRATQVRATTVKKVGVMKVKMAKLLAIQVIAGGEGKAIGKQRANPNRSS